MESLSGFRASHKNIRTENPCVFTHWILNPMFTIKSLNALDPKSCAEEKALAGAAILHSCIMTQLQELVDFGRAVIMPNYVKIALGWHYGHDHF